MVKIGVTLDAIYLGAGVLDERGDCADGWHQWSRCASGAPAVHYCGDEDVERITTSILPYFTKLVMIDVWR